MNKKIIAVFGGSFNPPTIAHIDLAKQIITNIEDIEKIIFVPVSIKYRKDGLAPDKTRLEMLKKICEKHKNLEVSSIELDSNRQLYTIETLDKIKSENPDKEIYFILGTDNLKELETWHNAEELISKYKFLVLKRNNDNIENIIENCNLLKKYRKAFVNLKNIKEINLSACQVREKIKNGQCISNLVPQEIEDMVINEYRK